MGVLSHEPVLTATSGVQMLRKPDLPRPAACPWLRLSFARVLKEPRHHPVAPDRAAARRLNAHRGE